MTPAGIDPAAFRFVPQHLNRCATAVPQIHYNTNIYCTNFDAFNHLCFYGRFTGVQKLPEDDKGRPRNVTVINRTKKYTIVTLERLLVLLCELFVNMTTWITFKIIARSLATLFSARKGKLQDRLNEAHNPFLPNPLQFINHRTIQR